VFENLAARAPPKARAAAEAPAKMLYNLNPFDGRTRDLTTRRP
jgi:hypothetical protein